MIAVDILSIRAGLNIRWSVQVDLYENGTIAIVEAVSPELGNRVQRVRVQLPGTSSELLGKFRDKKVDFAAHSQTEDGGAVFLNLLGEHAFAAAALLLPPFIVGAVCFCSHAMGHLFIFCTVALS